LARTLDLLNRRKSGMRDGGAIRLIADHQVQVCVARAWTDANALTRHHQHYVTLPLAPAATALDVEWPTVPGFETEDISGFNALPVSVFVA
jgi:hypothetical protein